MDILGRMFPDFTGSRRSNLFIPIAGLPPLKRGLDPILWKVAAGADLEATFSWSSLSTSVFIVVLLQLNKGGTSLLTFLFGLEYLLSHILALRKIYCPLVGC